MRRALLKSTAVARINVSGAQLELNTPLVANDGIVSNPVDEFARPPKSAEMINKYGSFAKYVTPAHTKVDVSGEIKLNTYPEGPIEGRMENQGHDPADYKASWVDEKFFRENILKPKASVRNEDRARTVDAALNMCTIAITALAVRYFLASIWWIGQPRMTLVNESNIEVEIGEMAPKECKTIVWRGKPVYIYRRSEQQMKSLIETPMSALKHPETDESRFPTNREYAVVIAICTHLGCIPAANEGAFGGFFCPCHGSHYDASARIRTGPAPLNLEIPPMNWIDEGTVYLGT